MGEVVEEKTLIPDSYREFIQHWIEAKKRERKQFGYATLAKKCGFRSKSFIRDVCLGYKSISLSSMHRLSYGMELNKENALLFELLVKSEHPEICTHPEEAKQAQSRILAMRQASKPSIDVGHAGAQLNFSLYRFLNWPKIFSLLDNAKYKSFKVIQKASKMEKFLLREILRDMEFYKLVYKKDDSYKAKNKFLMIPELEGNEFFKAYYLNQLRHSEQKAQENFEDTNNFFFNSTIAISSKDYESFKFDFIENLKALLNQYENSDGDRVIDVNASIL